MSRSPNPFFRMHDQIDRPPRVQMHEHERGQKKDTFANKLLHAVSSVCECVGNFHAPTICRYSTSPSFLALSLLSISFRLFCTRRFSSSSPLVSLSHSLSLSFSLSLPSTIESACR